MPSRFRSGRRVHYSSLEHIGRKVSILLVLKVNLVDAQPLPLPLGAASVYISSKRTVFLILEKFKFFYLGPPAGGKLGTLRTKRTSRLVAVHSWSRSRTVGGGKDLRRVRGTRDCKSRSGVNAVGRVVSRFTKSSPSSGDFLANFK